MSKKSENTMDYEQAKVQMKTGEWVRHRLFAENEQMTVLPNNHCLYLFEDGYTCFVSDFERLRFTNSNTKEAWTKSGWSIINAPKNLKKCRYCGVFTSQPEHECYMKP